MSMHLQFSQRMLHSIMGEQPQTYIQIWDTKNKLEEFSYIFHSYDSMIFIVLTYEASSFSYRHPQAKTTKVDNYFLMRNGFFQTKCDALKGQRQKRVIGVVIGPNWNWFTENMASGTASSPENKLYEYEIYLNDFLGLWLPANLLWLLDNWTGSQFTSTILPS